MILLIDNYDSFSYNLFQMLGEIEPDITVVKNDAVSVDEIRKMKPDHIIISPGPGRPENAGIIVEAAASVCREIPTLGVCLGHQAICQAYGAKITYAKRLVHGKQSDVTADLESPVFKDCPKRFPVARYHSLAVDAASMPECLKVTASTADGEVMAVQHRSYPIFGLQFHPESIMTPLGDVILNNFLQI